MLRDHPEISARLAQPAPGLRVLEGHFNGSPLAVLLVEERPTGPMVTALVVHPASRNRGVGSTLLREACAWLPGLGWPDELARLARKAGL
ncbi:GNAT family N-acetyltransferase [Alcanivorax sp. JB21]|uniref:GNAT family N-acetyltransferase n=1 Tax=Alcanivorax limicola TaxID=2874102 RepID=UPI001CC06472|nr:GNAT family N-acetyltransferase [Alcanivorax limicola]MBZ2189233.1 GNAT family N-acetyltransferase [Alcanivorax limicola]